jgi:hypothetical protein
MQSGSPPESWQTAPERIALPPEWSKAFKDLANKTMIDGKERGACLSYGRKISVQQQLAKDMLKLSHIEEQYRIELANNNEAAAHELGDEAKIIRQRLESIAGGDAVPNFEINLVLEGQAMTTHMPVCLGSQLGSMHTHPYVKKFGDFDLPSEGDVGVTFYHFVKEHERAHVVVNGAATRTNMIVVTGELLKRFDLSNDTMVDRNDGYSARKKLKEDAFKVHWLVASIEANVQDRDIETNMVAAALKQFGMILYQGDLTNLYKINVPRSISDAHSRILYMDGKFLPRRTLIDNLHVLTKLIVNDPLSIGTEDDVVGINQLTRRILKMDSDEYLRVIGYSDKQKDIRNIATSLTDAVFVGGCYSWSEKEFSYYSECWSNWNNTVRKLPKCSKFTWQIIDNNFTFYRSSSKPNSSNNCIKIKYRMLPDLTIGELLGEYSVIE